MHFSSSTLNNVTNIVMLIKGDDMCEIRFVTDNGFKNEPLTVFCRATTGKQFEYLPDVGEKRINLVMEKFDANANQDN
jgi:hypothetical protein